MKLKCTKVAEDAANSSLNILFQNRYTLGKVYIARNNSWDEKCPVMIETDGGYPHYCSHEFIAQHFEAIVTPAVSDIIFKMAEDAKEPEDFESIAFLINGAIDELGGFACFNAQDIKREFEARL